MSETHTVTGAFGYSGKYIAKMLLENGLRVNTLTNSPERKNPFGGQIKAHPFNFDDVGKLEKTLYGTSVLYNTYWARFNYGNFSHIIAVANTLKLFSVAQKAGVRRIVHVSITNPSITSSLEYFRSKAILENALKNLGLSYAILRPAVLFGHEDILINNIAWFLRKFPIFGVFGSGEYKLQPIFVEDFARLAVNSGCNTNNEIINAIGPETFTFRGLVESIGAAINKPRPVVSLPPSVGYVFGLFAGKILGDVVLTKDEIRGLMRGLLCTNSEPAGTTKLTDWAKTNADTLGIKYASELHRRLNRNLAYAELGK